jgi:MscS family membrane protein
VGLPVLYLLTGFLNRLLSLPISLLTRRLRAKHGLQVPEVLPRPIRLLILTLFIRWMLSRYELPILQRQFWVSTSSILAIAAVVWLVILLNGGIEWLIRERLARKHRTGAYSILRLGRRMIDILVIIVGVLVGLNHFGLNPTTALAGLGIGGIAVALAAQKTLENLIGGTSVIFDSVLHVGDFVTIGSATGTVEDIGLRSTRIRTLARTIVSLPNGQVANANLESISLRDKFWFRHELNLHKGTTASQMRDFVEGLKKLLAEHPGIDPDSFRVSFLRLSAFSLDVEVFAYFFAGGWNQFLEIQAELLLRTMELLESIGIQMAIQPYDVQFNPQVEGDNAMTADANQLPINQAVIGVPKTAARG